MSGQAAQQAKKLWSSWSTRIVRKNVTCDRPPNTPTSEVSIYLYQFNHNLVYFLFVLLFNPSRG